MGDFHYKAAPRFDYFTSSDLKLTFEAFHAFAGD